MKRFWSFLALFCLFLRAGAQENRSEQGVLVGQVVPDVLVTGVSGLKVDGKVLGPSFRLSALRGKLVILDFWATWCQPCRAMVPVMDSLQRVLGEGLVILPVAYQAAAVVAPVLSDMQSIKSFTLPGVTGDKVLNGLFPHRYLPHYVWIDQKGKVLAITEEKQVTGPNLRAAMAGRRLEMETKQDLAIPYSASKLLFMGGNGGDGAAVSYHSVLSAYVPGLRAGMDIVPGQRFTVRNVAFTWLIRMAYSDHDRWFTAARIRLLSADSGRMTTRLSGQAYEAWLKQGHGWCYELQVPPELAGRAFEIMQEDVGRLFPAYRVSVERTTVPCLVLVRTSAVDKLHTSGGDPRVAIGPYGGELRNVRLSQLVKRLEVQYLQDSPLPIVDETAYAGPVDLSLHAQMYRVEDLNRELEKYDLRFVTRPAAVDLLVVRDVH